MIPIPLYRQSRVEAISYIDDADLPLVSPFRWHLNTHGYAMATGGRLMHRLIMQPGPSLQVDHLDHDRLRNTRENLRVVTHSQNGMNQLRPGRIVGVSWHRSARKWHAYIRIDYKRQYLGTFKNKHDAIAARYTAVIAYWKARLLPVPDVIQRHYVAALLGAA